MYVRMIFYYVKEQDGKFIVSCADSNNDPQLFERLSKTTNFYTEKTVDMAEQIAWFKNKDILKKKKEDDSFGQEDNSDGIHRGDDGTLTDRIRRYFLRHF